MGPRKVGTVHPRKVGKMETQKYHQVGTCKVGTVYPRKVETPRCHQKGPHKVEKVVHHHDQGFEWWILKWVGQDLQHNLCFFL